MYVIFIFENIPHHIYYKTNNKCFRKILYFSKLIITAIIKFYLII